MMTKKIWHRPLFFLRVKVRVSSTQSTYVDLVVQIHSLDPRINEAF
jgi:hypothetical protein